jgi:hypothetical protein
VGHNRKMAIEKLTARLKNTIQSNQQIKNCKKSHDLRLIKPQT